MRQNRWMVSLFAAGAVAFSAGAADAVKPAPAKAAPAEKADAKKAVSYTHLTLPTILLV